MAGRRLKGDEFGFKIKRISPYSAVELKSNLDVSCEFLLELS